MHTVLSLACWSRTSLLFVVDSKLSLPGRAELQKLGPPSRCPEALSPGPGGCKGPDVSRTAHCQGIWASSVNWKPLLLQFSHVLWS